MLSQSDKCPLCLNRYGGVSRRSGEGGRDVYFECDLCGQFGVARNLVGDHDMLSRDVDRLNSDVKRGVLIRAVRRRINHPGPNTFVLTFEELGEILSNERTPSPAEQAAATIRYVGDEVSRTGRPIEALPLHFFADIGAPSPERAGRIMGELIGQGLLVGAVAKPGVLAILGDKQVEQKELTASGLDLTFAGWERYEAEKRGRFAGSYGFLAMKFGDGVLDPFMRDHVKPGLKAAMGFDLIDMRDAARTGIIDNLMREKIRDAAFVIVDLTHDNYGAYWEAGYAEGLGKPVLYICEHSKFREAGSHFDTNHLTTVLWDVAKPADFIADLAATLRRSLEM